MLLRKLELYGFKSFADKTEIEFGPGITAIVGPNGSGKSNISDAIRWALGEQSIRNLRGNKAEDIIFAGSSDHRALGVAEVTLIFDNSDGSLPLSFNEVTITRRVFRSGDSEYYINKAPCRLKDIHELLANTGLGREAMSVIGQNKIDEILNAKPEERRLIFEDAAGISKYKQRKREALRKLEDTSNNLTRVSDITTEIESQLAPLAESAEKTKCYQQLKATWTSCQLSLIMNKIAKAEKMVESAELERSNTSANEVAVSARLAVVEADKERQTNELAQNDRQIRETETALNQTNVEIEREAAKAAVIEEKSNQALQAQTRLVQQREVISQRLQNLDHKQMTLATEVTAKQKLGAELTEESATFSQRYQSITQMIGQLENSLASGSQTAFGNLEEIVDQRNQLHTAERELTALTQRQQTLAEELAQYQRESAQAVQNLATRQAEISSVKDSIVKLGSEHKLTSEKKHDVQCKIEELTAQQTIVANKISELNSRLKILTGMQKEFDGFGRGIKAILKSNANWRQGIHGAVAQIISMPKQYITAIETALGGALQHLVCHDDWTAKQAIHFLQQNKLGRATFLPLNTIRPTHRKDAELAAATMTGVEGIAVDLVRCEPQFQSVMDYLLGRTIVAEDIDAALRVGKQTGFKMKVVTLDGQLVNPGGSLTGGSVQRRESSFISRTQEITTLKTQLPQLTGDLDLLAKKRDAQLAALAACEQQLQEIEQLQRQAMVHEAELAVHIAKCEQEITRLNLAVQTTTNACAACCQEQATWHEQQLQLASALSAVETRDNEHKQQLQVWQDDLQQLKAEKESVNNQLTELKVSAKALQQEIILAQTTLKQYSADRQTMTAELEQNSTERKQITGLLAQYARDLDTSNSAVAALRAKQAELEQSKQAALAQKLEILSQNQRTDKEIKELRHKNQQLQTRLHEIEIIATKYKYELSQCHEQITSQFGLSIAQARTLCREEDTEKLIAASRDLERQINELGPVNPTAVDEYQRLNDRYQFLQKQFNDLVAAKEYLGSIIAEINLTMSKQFKTAFQSINKHFQDIFSKLFGGGTASLDLLDPSNLLETGIEIEVQPPGKKQQNLALLSGGERSLTVIAVLLAFLTYRPAPFCVVDEIDAALDEANVQRFSEFISEYAQKTQFIVVTHRKGTMEVANVMHGVTMEQSGISKLVSVKFMDKAG